MMIIHLLQPRGQTSESYRLSRKIVGYLLDSEPRATVIIRPISGAIADLDERYATARWGRAIVRGTVAEGSMSRSEELIHEMESADFVVIATPMHNFTVPCRSQGVD
ncbi:NAD(P)H-dependent oxidoreductase [Bradyrhizobium sp. 2TAF36]|uniref:NAD(P)H-dependent oxidoreductase n=1 Tax=Bradyrhizobium sp. 2TAF36 TaxID=3233016 RepID=UPI003F9372BC